VETSVVDNEAEAYVVNGAFIGVLLGAWGRSISQQAFYVSNLSSGSRHLALHVAWMLRNMSAAAMQSFLIVPLITLFSTTIISPTFPIHTRRLTII